MTFNSVLLAIGDNDSFNNDSIWNGFSGVILGLLIGIALVIYIVKAVQHK